MSEAKETQAHSNPGTTLSEPIHQNISDIVELHEKELAQLAPAQRRLEAVSRRVAQPGYVVGIVALSVVWVSFNLFARQFGAAPFDPAPFAWLQGLLTLTALLTATVVLIGQSRQTRLAEQRAHLDLQINLLTEQKVTKLIHLLEELRSDLPGVRERTDPHVSALKEPTDAASLLSALKDTGLTGEPPSRPEKK
jgi:uncharacterized membrane protein